MTPAWAQSPAPDPAARWKSLIAEGVQGLWDEKSDRSEVKFRAALQIAEDLGDEERVAGTLGFLGDLLVLRGRCAEAEPVVARLLAIREKAGDVHEEERIDALLAAGRLYRAWGRFEDAGRNLREALGRVEAKHGIDGIRSVPVLRELGRLEDAGKMPASADRYYRRALEALEKNLPSDHPDLARELHAQATRGLALGMTVSAEAQARRALALREKVLKPDDPARGRTLALLGAVLDAEGGSAEARACFDRALSVFAKAPASDRSDEAVVLMLVAFHEMIGGRLAEAVDPLQRSLDLLQDKDDPARPALARVFRELSRTKEIPANAEALQALKNTGLYYQAQLLAYGQARELSGRGSEDAGLLWNECLAMRIQPLLSDEERWALERVGEAGDLACLVFEGNAAFPADQLRDALRLSLDVQFAAHPSAILSDYLALLRELTLSGYRHAGFLQARVDAVLDPPTGNVCVRIEEGPRFTAAGVRVVGARSVPVERLTDGLTKPWLPPAPDPKERKEGESSGTEKKEDPPKPQDPVWEPGKSAHGAAASVRAIEARVREVLAAEGCPFALIHAEISTAATARGKAELVVYVEDEGPKDLIGEIEVLGAERNKPEEILRLADLAPGMALTREKRARVDAALDASGRFIRHEIRTDRSKTQRDRLKVTVEVLEHRKISRLSEPFTPEERILLKFRDRLDAFMAGEEDLVSAAESPDHSMKAGFVLSPRQGVWLEYWGPAYSNVSVHYQCLATQGRIAMISPKSRRKFTCPVADGRIVGQISYLPVEPVEDPSRPACSLRLAVGFASERKPGDPPVGIQVKTANVAILDLAGGADRFEYVEKGGVMRLVRSGVAIRIDAGTGALLGVEPAEPDPAGGSYFGRLEAGALDRKIRETEAETAAYEECYREADPITSFAEFAALEWIEWSAASSEQMEPFRRAAGAVKRIFDRFGGTSEEKEKATDESSTEGDDEGFVIPDIQEELARVEGSGSAAQVFRVLLPFCDDLFPRRSWPWTLVREAAFSLCGKSKYAAAELNAMMKPGEIGPLGHLALAAWLDYVGSSSTPDVARHGMKLVAAEEFRKDLAVLLEPGRPQVALMVRLAEALRDLPEKDLEDLIAPLPADDAETLRGAARTLREGKGRPTGELLMEVLAETWESSLADRVAKMLKGYAEPK